MMTENSPKDGASGPSTAGKLDQYTQLGQEAGRAYNTSVLYSDGKAGSLRSKHTDIYNQIRQKELAGDPDTPKGSADAYAAAYKNYVGDHDDLTKRAPNTPTPPRRSYAPPNDSKPASSGQDKPPEPPVQKADSSSAVADINTDAEVNDAPPQPVKTAPTPAPKPASPVQATADQGLQRKSGPLTASDIDGMSDDYIGALGKQLRQECNTGRSKSAAYSDYVRMYNDLSRLSKKKALAFKKAFFADDKAAAEETAPAPQSEQPTSSNKPETQTDASAPPAPTSEPEKAAAESAPPPEDFEARAKRFGEIWQKAKKARDAAYARPGGTAEANAQQNIMDRALYDLLDPDGNIAHPANGASHTHQSDAVREKEPARKAPSAAETQGRQQAVTLQKSYDHGLAYERQAKLVDDRARTINAMPAGPEKDAALKNLRQDIRTYYDHWVAEQADIEAEGKGVGLATKDIGRAIGQGKNAGWEERVRSPTAGNLPPAGKGGARAPAGEAAAEGSAGLPGGEAAADGGFLTMGAMELAEKADDNNDRLYDAASDKLTLEHLKAEAQENQENDENELAAAQKDQRDAQTAIDKDPHDSYAQLALRSASERAYVAQIKLTRDKEIARTWKEGADKGIVDSLTHSADDAAEQAQNSRVMAEQELPGSKHDDKLTYKTLKSRIQNGYGDLKEAGHAKLAVQRAMADDRKAAEEAVAAADAQQGFDKRVAWVKSVEATQDLMATESMASGIRAQVTADTAKQKEREADLKEARKAKDAKRIAEDQRYISFYKTEIPQEAKAADALDQRVGRGKPDGLEARAEQAAAEYAAVDPRGTLLRERDEVTYADEGLVSLSKGGTYRNNELDDRDASETQLAYGIGKTEAFGVVAQTIQARPDLFPEGKGADALGPSADSNSMEYALGRRPTQKGQDGLSPIDMQNGEMDHAYEKGWQSVADAVERSSLNDAQKEALRQALNSAHDKQKAVFDQQVDDVRTARIKAARDAVPEGPVNSSPPQYQGGPVDTKAPNSSKNPDGMVKDGDSYYHVAPDGHLDYTHPLNFDGTPRTDLTIALNDSATTRISYQPDAPPHDPATASSPSFAMLKMAVLYKA